MMREYQSHRLSFLEDRHLGEACVLICNGPSLNKMDLSFLKQQTCVGLNKIYLGFKKFKFYPRYWVGVNPKVIEQSVNEIKELNCVKFLSKHNSSGLIAEDSLTYHINTQSPAERFCKDITQGVHEGWTVTYVALQIIYFLGFSKVVIIGMDHDFSYKGEPNQENMMEGTDLNHFAPGYFAEGQKWDNPDILNSEESYRLAKKIYEQGGREIIDATLDGKCDIFKKSHYKNLFRC